eukprot:6520024-Alexandrium_andersonii.AAC.1
MSASLVGSEMCIRDRFFLLAVSKAVGLQIDTHACLGARVNVPLRLAQQRLAALPLSLIHI